MRGDGTIERAADGLRRASERAAARGGAAAKVADELADDAAFVRKLKPSLIVARAKGEEHMTEAPETTRIEAPPPPQEEGRNGGRAAGRASGGPSPLLFVAAAFLLGVALAKVLDWRSHAHPRD